MRKCPVQWWLRDLSFISLFSRTTHSPWSAITTMRTMTDLESCGQRAPSLRNLVCCYIKCLYLLLVALASCYPHLCLVTVCLNGTFGHDCSLTCDDCSNGGLCNTDRDGCDCPDGWTAIICNQSVYFIFCITIKFEIFNLGVRVQCCVE